MTSRVEMNSKDYVLIQAAAQGLGSFSSNSTAFLVNLSVFSKVYIYLWNYQPAGIFAVNDILKLTGQQIGQIQPHPPTTNHKFYRLVEI